MHQLDTSEWKQISSTAKDLVLKMLSPNPHHRPSITEVLDHPWIRVSNLATKIILLLLSV